MVAPSCIPPVQRLGPDDDLAPVLALLRSAFAYMEGRIDPPSSMHRLTREDMDQSCRTGEVWSLGAPPVACMVLTPRPACLYLGKLAVDQQLRGKGLAARMIGIARERALALGYDRLQLQTRVELVENHAIFARLGFVKTGETAHEGYDRPTSITMEAEVRGPEQ